MREAQANVPKVLAEVTADRRGACLGAGGRMKRFA
jgi:hypothetical protein